MSIVSKEKQKLINNEKARQIERARLHNKIKNDVEEGKQHTLNYI